MSQAFNHPPSGPPPGSHMDAAARSAVRRFLRKVGPSLRRVFGQRRNFSVDEVRSAIATVKLQPSHLEWACALYCSEREFEIAREVTGTKGDYAEMRQLVANFFFGGDRKFDPFDLKNAQGIGGPVKDKLGSAFDQIGGETRYGGGFTGTGGGDIGF